MKTLQIIKQDQDKTISLVEHETTHTKYIQKELNYYDKTLYQTLQKIKNPYLPKIFVIQESDNHLILIEEYIENNKEELEEYERNNVEKIVIRKSNTAEIALSIVYVFSLLLIISWFLTIIQLSSKIV